MTHPRQADDVLVTRTVAAPAEAVYALVSDVTRMGEWSPECYRCTWLDGGTGPRQGARFKGWNKQPLGPLPLKWATTSTVVVTSVAILISDYMITALWGV